MAIIRSHEDAHQFAIAVIAFSLGLYGYRAVAKGAVRGHRDATWRGLDRLVSGPEAGVYWPHLAVAYATGHGPIDSVRRSWFRSVIGLSWRVSAVAFIELRH